MGVPAWHSLATDFLVPIAINFETIKKRPTCLPRYIYKNKAVWATCYWTLAQPIHPIREFEVVEFRDG